MATTKKMTNAIALTIALEVAKGADIADACAAHDFTSEELIAKLERMYETATKPRNTSGEKRPTKEQIQALAMMKDAVAQMREFGEPVGTSWIMEHVQYCTSSQKATSLMRKAMSLNLVKKVDSVKGKVQYVVL